MNAAARKIVELNIQHFRDLLEEEKDLAKRETILRRLQEQERMLAKLDNARTD